MLIARKNKETGEIEYVEGTPVDAELNENSSNAVQNRAVTSKFNEVAEEMEALKKSVSDGKSLVANAITANGVATSADETFQTMADNIIAVAQNKYKEGATNSQSTLATAITSFNVSMSVLRATCTWTLPSDSARSGIEIWAKTSNSFSGTPSGTKMYDSNTQLGTTATSASFEFPTTGTYYVAIYSYTYINNVRKYTLGKVVSAIAAYPKGSQVFTTNGTFTVPADVPFIDVFLVGGGSGGSSGYLSGSYTACGGDGGNGGKILTETKISVREGQTYQVTIGSKNGGNTLFGSLSSANGSIKGSGGRGAYANWSSTPACRTAYSGDNGVYAFGDSSFNGIRYGAGGGGGGAYSGGNTESNYAQGSGGTTGGGKGGYKSYSGAVSPADGQNNTGSGGGGGLGYVSGGNANNTSGGSGGTGICIVRWGY